MFLTRLNLKECGWKSRPEFNELRALDFEMHYVLLKIFWCIGILIVYMWGILALLTTLTKLAEWARDITYSHPNLQHSRITQKVDKQICPQLQPPFRHSAYEFDTVRTARSSKCGVKKGSATSEQGEVILCTQIHKLGRFRNGWIIKYQELTNWNFSLIVCGVPTNQNLGISWLPIGLPIRSFLTLVPRLRGQLKYTFPSFPPQILNYLSLLSKQTLNRPLDLL